MAAGLAARLARTGRSLLSRHSAVRVRLILLAGQVANVQILGLPKIWNSHHDIGRAGQAHQMFSLEFSSLNAAKSR
jgi:hypothetical protein